MDAKDMRRALCAVAILTWPNIFIEHSYGSSLMPRYTLEEIIFAESPGDFTEGVDINDLGVVLARTWNRNYADRAFLWEEGQAEMIFYTGSSQPYRINNSNVVTGRLTWNSNKSAGFIWQNSQLVEIAPSHKNAEWILPYALNDLNQVYAYGGSNFIEWEAGVVNEISIPVPGIPEPKAVNDFGQLVGFSIEGPPHFHGRAWTWFNGIATELVGLEEFAYTDAHGINNHGVIVGASSIQGAAHAVRWKNGTPEDLLEPPGGIAASYAKDINDRGWIVGSGYDVQGEKAILWNPDGTMFVLDDLLETSGWKLTQARAINNRGQIVGWGTNPQGIMHGFVLTPIPEPMSLMFVVSGAASLLFKRKLV